MHKNLQLNIAVFLVLAANFFQRQTAIVDCEEPHKTRVCFRSISIRR